MARWLSQNDLLVPLLLESSNGAAARAKTALVRSGGRAGMVTRNFEKSSPFSPFFAIFWLQKNEKLKVLSSSAKNKPPARDPHLRHQLGGTAELARHNLDGGGRGAGVVARRAGVGSPCSRTAQSPPCGGWHGGLGLRVGGLSALAEPPQFVALVADERLTAVGAEALVLDALGNRNGFGAP